MSCRWDVVCVDCRKYAGVDNANREVELMQFLVTKRSVLANLSRLDLPNSTLNVELQINGHYIDLKFFAEHETHLLRPVDEYGNYDTPCKQTFLCPRCKTYYACADREHPGKPHHHLTTDHSYHCS